MRYLIVIAIGIILIGGYLGYKTYFPYPPVPTYKGDAHPELPLKFYSWKNPDPAYVLTPLIRYGAKSKLVSPKNSYNARLIDNSIEIDNKTNKKLWTVPLDRNRTKAQYFWITDSYLIIVEKAKDENHLDYFYIVDMQNGIKQYFTGSFAVPTRLNLDKKITVYREGHVLMMEDNKGALWQLDLMF